MNIGFDAKRAFLNQSGLGSYSRNLIVAMHEHSLHNNFSLFTPRTIPSEFESFVKSQRNIQIITPGKSITKRLPSLWRSFLMPLEFSKYNLNIYHGLSNELPLTLANNQIKKVVTIHDLIFLRYPKLYPFIDRNIYHLKFKQACVKADKIIAVSAQTKSDIIEFLNISEKKIEIIPPLVDPLYHKVLTPVEIKNALKKYNLPYNYLLYLGTIEERKNLLTIVKAIKISKEKISLVVAGRSTPYIDKVQQYIAENKLANSVIFLNHIPAQDLPALYQGATIFIYPSLFEGFGMPVLEAIYSRVPVITSNSSSLPEAGGNAAIYIDPKNAEQLANAIETILHSSEKKQEMITAGNLHTQKFKPEVLTTQLLNLYKNL